jgi:hypothetical protein
MKHTGRHFFKAHQAFDGSQTAADLKCNDLGDKYIERNMLSDLINSTYCPKLEGATGPVGTGHYLSDTPESVEIGITDGDTPNYVPSPDECVQNFHKLLNGCNYDHSTNPMNWKAGGEVKMKDLTYSITPTETRPQAPQKPSAWCQLQECEADGWCPVYLWGAGWLNHDFGTALQKALEKLDVPAIWGVDEGSWNEWFRYENVDNHEWAINITVSPTVAENLAFVFIGPKLIVETMRYVANPQDPGYLQLSDCSLLG